MNDCFTALGRTLQGRMVRGKPRLFGKGRLQKRETIKAELKSWEGTGQGVLVRKRDGLMRLLA